MIKIEEDIDLPVPAAAVWKVISTPNEVVTCVEGASLGEEFEDGSLAATLTVKLGPLRVSFNERVWVDFDDTSMTGKMVATGRDGHGGTRTKTSATFSVVALDHQHTTVSIRGDVDLAGKLASLIESSANVVVKRMVGEFTTELEARCVPPMPPTEDETPPLPSHQTPSDRDTRARGGFFRWLRALRLRRKRASRRDISTDPK